MDSRYRQCCEQGLAAAVAVARSLGLPAAGPRVLSARGNLLVHFAPAPAVARVATLTAWTRRDPEAWLAREVLVAGRAFARGGPVVAPSATVAPGPHRRRGFVLTFWEYVEAWTVRPNSAEAGEALAALHAATAGERLALPWLAPACEQIDDGLHALERAKALPPRVCAALRREHGAVLDGLVGAGSAAIVLHGDAHPGNLLGAHGARLWTDLEETCVGPPEWDLAVLAGQPGGAAALRGYAAAAGTAVPSRRELLPFHRARELEATVWLLGMAQSYPQRYRRRAAERLAAFGLR